MQLTAITCKIHHMKNGVIQKPLIRKQEQCSVRYSSYYMLRKMLTADVMFY